ncbi:nitroreductase family protein [Clostridium sp. D2Q-11]|uniref:Nitroreductase family protein n=1 Tax=Anaeromonas frigoriresistens TaxID=2683708 RepID=A0A942UVY5_9FIRM|nr:nitroreductase family protein [Anaeromonas frigoriresistens]MBS4539593.1 nitroreductase family protein [Anaeromonas frigoriresistens]
MTRNFYEAIESRRSKYGISDESPISDERIEEVVKEAVKYTPTAFNSQSGRVVLLLKDKHKKLWDITEDALRKVVPEKNFSDTKEKIESFRSGYGTVLFFEDQSVIEGLQEQFELYKDNFPMWSQQASGILQFIVWTSFDIQGLGATLQHYNELIEEDVKNEWNIPSNWKLIAQMPFGKPTVPAGDKEFESLEDRVKVIM